MSSTLIGGILAAITTIALLIMVGMYANKKIDVENNRKALSLLAFTPLPLIVLSSFLSKEITIYNWLNWLIGIIIMLVIIGGSVAATLLVEKKRLYVILQAVNTLLCFIFIALFLLSLD